MKEKETVLYVVCEGRSRAKEEELTKLLEVRSNVMAVEMADVEGCIKSDCAYNISTIAIEVPENLTMEQLDFLVSTERTIIVPKYKDIFVFRNTSADDRTWPTMVTVCDGWEKLNINISREEYTV